MAPKILLLFLAMAAILFLAQSTQAQEPVNEFCKTASHKILCTKMVNGAKTMHDASKNAIENTLNAAKKLQAMSNLIGPVLSRLKPVTKDSILSTCVEDFETTVDDLERSLQALEEKDEGTLLTHLSAAYNSDCTDAFQEMGAKGRRFGQLAGLAQGSPIKVSFLPLALPVIQMQRKGEF
ncbi:pectinesterase inhibitor-like [Olea europaea subsp. europaea]|uniref:Pectinesterase inhibitor-like n=1 Tax=Olea europaea subsp. europaea TaxID=158383 RepID=A0A8S0Q5Y3_OLEEU|nr:pectinesterase inhibitor-like [Olea europaea subsp. europaea]